MADALKTAQNAKEASRILSRLETKIKNQFLHKLSDALVNQEEAILAANSQDVQKSIISGASKAFIERLSLNKSRIEGLSGAVRNIAILEDPVGKILESKFLPNGLSLEKVSVPFGSILMIYESRPNVTIDAAALCIKSGNAVILKGGKEAFETNSLLHSIMHDCLLATGIPANSVSLIRNMDREYLHELLRLDKQIDLVIPRGGEGLVNAVSERSRIPVLKNAKGVCHVFIDNSADLEMALSICLNAKVQRPAVCNAMETLIVHEQIAQKFLPNLVEKMNLNSVELRGDIKARLICPSIEEATEEDWDQEYGDLILAVLIASSLDDALSHIAIHGSGHSEAIVTECPKNRRRFLDEVDAAVVYSNASTRFTDGGELGMGAEIGISTGKLHARGPIGLRELCSYKFMITGDGQVRK